MVKNLPAKAGDTGSISWSGKIPHVLEQLSLGSTTIEPVQQSPCSATREPTTVRSPHPVKKSSPLSLQLQKSLCSSEDPEQPKINK